LELIHSLLKRSAIRVRLSGNQAAADSVRHIAVDGILLRQEDKPIMHRPAREISHETAILRSSVHMIFHCDLQLRCFKRRLKPIASPVSLDDKQPYRLQ